MKSLTTYQLKQKQASRTKVWEHVGKESDCIYASEKRVGCTFPHMLYYLTKFYITCSVKTQTRMGKKCSLYLDLLQGKPGIGKRRITSIIDKLCNIQV